jgi:hypothetical protein
MCEVRIDATQHPEIFATLLGSVHAAVQGGQGKQAKQQQQQQQRSQALSDAEMEGLGLLMPCLMHLRGEEKALAHVQEMVEACISHAAEQALSSSSSKGVPAKQQQQQQQDGAFDASELVSAGAALISVSMELQLAHSLAMSKMKLDATTVKHCQLCMKTINNAAIQAAKDKHQQLLQRQQVPQSQQVRMPTKGPLSKDGEFVINDDQQLPAAYVSGLQEATRLAGQTALMYCITLASYKPQFTDKPLDKFTAEESERSSAEFSAALCGNYKLLLGYGPEFVGPSDFSSSSSSSNSSSVAAAAAAGSSKSEGWGRAETFAGLKGLFTGSSGSSSGGKAAAAAAAKISSGSSSSSAGAAALAAAAGDLSTRVRAWYWSSDITMFREDMVRWGLPSSVRCRCKFDMSWGSQ